MAGQPQAGLGADRHPRAAGNRIEDHREGGGVGYGGKMRNQSLLGRLVVVGRHMEESVRPQAGRQLGPGHRVGGVVAARPGNDRNPMVYLLYHKGDHLGVFLLGEGRGFAGGAAGDDRINTALDQFVQKPVQGGEVYREIRMHGGDNGGGSAGKDWLFHKKHGLLGGKIRPSRAGRPCFTLCRTYRSKYPLAA